MVSAWCIECIWIINQSLLAPEKLGKTFFAEDEVVPSLIGDKVKMDETLSYDQEDALVRGQIPLYEFKEVLKAQDESKITTIDFSRNGYCNDAVLKLIATEKKLTEHYNLRSTTFCFVETICELEDCEFSGLYPCDKCWHQMANRYSRWSKNFDREELKVGHAIVIPHESVEHSFVEFVKTKKPVKRLPFHHETDVEVNDWLMSFTEMSLEHPLLDCMINSHQTQILIPFGESAVIKEIKKHVTDTIARTITKTAFTTDYMKNSGEVEKINPVIDIEVEDFLTIQNICKQHYTDEGVLGNYCYKDELLGCFVSRTTLTRSNYYFECELVNVKVISPDGTTVKVEDSEDDDDSENESESKSGILIGCLFNQLFSSINPLDVDVDKGGEVSTFDFTKCKKFGFGIKGEWLSEYIPSKTAKFFATCDGIENNKDLTGTSVPEEMLYPLIAVIGEKNNSGNVKISNLAKPPENLTRKYAKENRWISTGYSENILIDNYGVMCNSSPNEDEGMFISMEAITQEFSIKVLDKGNFGKIKIALSKEKEKDKEMQKSESWIYQGVTGEVISEKRPKYLEDPGRVETGDILTVKFDNKDGEKVVLYKNGKEIVETAFTPDKDDNRSIVKLYIFLSEVKGKVQLLNYRPKYRGPVLFPESLTVGRLHNMIVFDDGKIVTPIPKKKKDIFYGCYMGKFPMNSQRLSFEVEITEELNDELDAVAVGFCHSEIPQIIGSAKQYKDPATHFEVSGGCVMFSSGGNVFAESVVQSSFREEGKYKKGDKIKCEVEKVSSAEKLLFEEDGSISPQQDVNIKFFVNDTLTHQYTMTMRSDGLFPTVFTNGNISKEVTLRVLNFYAETEENRKKANLEQYDKKKKKKSEKEEGQKKEKVPCPNFKDCEFIVVEVGKTEGKLQLIEEQLKGDKFQNTLETMAKSIEYYEKNFKDLDLLDQNKYASLCQAKEKIEGLVNNFSRIQYMSLDLTTGKGMDKVLERVTDTMDCRKLHQEVKYNIPKKCQGHIQTIMKELKKEKVIEFGTGLTMFEEKTLKMEGHEFLQIAKLLHEQGKLALLQLGSRTIVADIEYLQSMLDKLERMSDMVKCGNLSTAISEASHVWTSETVMSHFTAEAGKISVLMEILQDYFGLVEVPVWRHVPEDTQFLYTTLDNLSTAPIPLREFWGEGERTKNFIAMQKTFSFIHSISDHTLAAVLSSATKYGRTLLITPEGAVFQIGCVQTVIASHKGLLENSVITIESKCYLPDMKVGPVDELTETYVREYTWNIFCLYTDLLEKVLKQKNIIYLQTGEAPTDLANLSVGCKHTWKHIPGKANQSICTMCNKCCDQGRKCKYNRIMGNNLRECLCKTSSPGCVDCGICIDCAADLWSIRSYLRPMPITEKNSKVVKIEKVEVKPSDTTEDKNVQKKVTPEETNNVFLQIPLDPVTFNELEYQHISGGSLGVVLKEIDDGSCVSIFPGKATTLSTDTDEQKISDRIKVLMKQATDSKYKSTVGESLKLRITDPFKLITTGEDKLEISGIQESRVVYHASICREMSVSHESGLLCYNSASHSVPKVSLKIIDCGDKTNIGIGICPGKAYPVNRMPGWNRWSIAYHADDGGIFIEAGAANSHVVKCTKGDVMSMFCDVVSKQLVFYKNDQEVKQIKINIPRGGYWPMIGMHSVGECVKLLEKDPWTPDPDDVSRIPDCFVMDRIPPKPASFKTYKYGNLWISPARNVSLTKKGYTANQCGWMLLHNPTKVLIGYKEDAVTIQWIAIEQVKEYSTDQILQLFDAASSSSTYTHRLGLLIKDTALGDVETLPKFQDLGSTSGDGASPVKQDGYKLEVFKNCILVDSYLLKRGRYILDLVDLDKTKPDYIIKRPKCPSFLYPPKLQKGMKVVVKLDIDSSGDQFADAVISEIYDGGGYCFEYTSPGKVYTGNEKICVGTMDCGIEDADWEEIERKGNKEEMKIQLLSSPSNMSLLHRTYVPAPPHLVTKVRYTMCNTVRTYVPAPPHLVTKVSYTMCYTVRTYVPAPPHLGTKVRYTMCNTVRTYVPAPSHLVTKVRYTMCNTVRTYVPAPSHLVTKVRYTMCNTVRIYVPAPPHLGTKVRYTMCNTVRIYVPAPPHLGTKVRYTMCNTVRTYVPAPSHLVTKVRYTMCNTVRTYVPAPPHLGTKVRYTMCNTVRIYVPAPPHLVTKVRYTMCNTVRTYVPAPPHLGTKVRYTMCNTVRIYVPAPPHLGTKVRYTMCNTVRTYVPAPPHLGTKVRYTMCNTVRIYVPAPPHLGTKVRYTMCNTVRIYVPAPPHLVTKVRIYVPAPPHLVTKVRYTMCNTVRIYVPAPSHLVTKVRYTMSQHSQNLCPSTTTPSYQEQSEPMSEPAPPHLGTKVRYTMCNTVRIYVSAPPHLGTKVRYTMCNTVRIYVPAPPHLGTKVRYTMCNTVRIYVPELGTKVRYTMCNTVRIYVPAPPHLVTKVRYTMCNTVRTYVPAPPHLGTKVRYTMCNTVRTYVPAPPHLVTKVRYTMCNTVRTYVPAPSHLVTKVRYQNNPAPPHLGTKVR
ncbi:LRRK2 [Mytilus edulis]|uniref:LRRK2 n=1 Tax=Mytilus edulis TaxID=6550 RepID=A0A8S3TTI5_MYTED|nr:LRRK2 [Mytilus edulis]